MKEEFAKTACDKLFDANVLTIKCRDCEADIWFLKNSLGKFTPMELNLEIHRCPNKPQRDFSEVKSDGQRKNNGRDKGWDRERGGRDW